MYKVYRYVSDEEISINEKLSNLIECKNNAIDWIIFFKNENNYQENNYLQDINNIKTVDNLKELNNIVFDYQFYYKTIGGNKMFNSLNYEKAYQELKEEKNINDIVTIHLKNETIKTYKDDFEIFRDYSEVCEWFNCGIYEDDDYYRKHNDNERMKEDYKEYYDIKYNCWIVLH